MSKTTQSVSTIARLSAQEADNLVSRYNTPGHHRIMDENGLMIYQTKPGNIIIVKLFLHRETHILCHDENMVCGFQDIASNAPLSLKEIWQNYVQYQYKFHNPYLVFTESYNTPQRIPMNSYNIAQHSISNDTLNPSTLTTITHPSVGGAGGTAGAGATAHPTSSSDPWSADLLVAQVEHSNTTPFVTPPWLLETPTTDTRLVIENPFASESDEEEVSVIGDT